MTFDPRILESCAIATGVSAVSLMALLPLGRRLGLVDYPDQGRKRHAFDTPLDLYYCYHHCHHQHQIYWTFYSIQPSNAPRMRHQ